MADQGPSIADIQRARNQKVGLEGGLRDNSDKVAGELQAAHVEAEDLKERLGGQDPVQQTQAFPHGIPSTAPQGDTMTDKIQHAQADLYSNLADKAANIGETIKGSIASADQATTTGARDTTATAAGKLKEAGGTAANAAGGVTETAADMLNRAKETVQGALGLGEGKSGGAVFGSDDPEYTRATEHVTETRTPALTPSEVKSFKSTDPSSGNQPTIASPKEGVAPGPTSLGEGSVGVSQGDSGGGDNVVASAKAAGRGVLDTVGLSGNASVSQRGALAPAGAESDPRLANIAVGDFKAINEAVAENSQAQAAGSTDVESTTAATADATDSTGASDAAPGVDTAALKQSASEAADSAKQSASEMADSAKQAASDAAARAREGVDSAIDSAKHATGMDTSATTTSSTGTAATSGGLLSSLAELVSGIATKANIASNSEELMAGGLVPDAAGNPAATSGPTAEPAPEAAAVADSISETAAAAKDKASDTAAAAKESVSDAAAEARDKASDSAASAKESVSDIAAATSDKTSETAAAAKDSVSDAAAAARDKASETAAGARDKVSDTAAAVKDKASETAAAVKETVSDAAAAVQQKASDAATAVKEKASDTAATAKDKASDGATAVNEKASETADGVARSARPDDQGSLVQDAKEGLVGAYDAAAGAAASAADKVQETAASLTPSGQQQQQPSSDQYPGSASAADREAAGGGSGAAGGKGVFAALKQGWEDLRHAGAPAPQAVANAGETAAPHDVTSNVERSKNLGDSQEQKIYDGEVYQVSPGGQSGQGDSGSHAAKSGAVAGVNKTVTGTTPHDKPDSYGVAADQQTRFGGTKGMNTGFGTGSAAPWDGHDSVKSVAEMFANTGSIDPCASTSLGFMTPEEQHRFMEAATQAGGNDSSGLRSWMNSMSAVWNNIGRAAAVGPKGNDALKDVEFDNPNQNVMIDPIRGVTKSESNTPGHKVQMRPADQIPTGGSSDDPNLLQHKAERLGKVVSDTLTTSSEEAAKDPSNLKGKSSDNKQDGTQYFLKREMADAGESLKAAPEKAAGAARTAGEIVGGVAQHIGQVITHPFSSAKKPEQAGASQAVGGTTGVAGESIYGVSVGAGEAGEAQDLQEKRMNVWASGEEPAKKRETLGDKVIGPMIGDATDPKRAKELADSYHKYKAAQASGEDTSNISSEGTGSSSTLSESSAQAVDTAPATPTELRERAGAKASELSDKASAAADKTGDKAAELSDKAGAKASELSDKAGAKASEVREQASTTASELSDKAAEAADTAGAKAAELSDKAGAKASELRERASATASDLSDKAAEAADTVGAKASELSDKAGAKASELRERASATASDFSDKAAEAADQAGAKAAELSDKAGAAVQGAVDSAKGPGREAKDTAKATGDITKAQGEAGLDGAKRAAGDASNKARDLSDKAGSKAQEMRDRAGQKAHEVRDRAADAADQTAEQASRTANEAKDAAAKAGEHAGATAGALLGNVVGGAKALLGGLLGPFEDQGTFEESTARVTDTSSATAHGGPRGAAAPAGAADFKQGAQETKEGLKTMGQAGVDKTAHAAGTVAGKADQVKEDVKGKAESLKEDTKDKAVSIKEDAKDKAASLKDDVKSTLQAGVDDTARAAGLVAGHTEAAVENILEQVNAVKENVAERVAEVTENIAVPPAEVPSNTEDLIRMKQQQAAQ